MPQITVDTGMNTKPVLQGVKQLHSAIRSLSSEISSSGKRINASVVGYAKAMSNRASLTREVNASIREQENLLKSLQNEMNQLAATRIDTQQYADVKKKVSELNKELRGLYQQQEKLRDIGKAAVPTKEYADNEKKIESYQKQLQKLEETFSKNEALTIGANTKQKELSKKISDESAKLGQYELKKNTAKVLENKKNYQKYSGLASESKKTIAAYEKEMAKAAAEEEKYGNANDVVIGKIEQLQNALANLTAQQEALKASGKDVLETEAMRKLQYEIDKTTKEYQKQQEIKANLEKSGKATIEGYNTKEYEDAYNKVEAQEKNLENLKETAKKTVVPLHIEQWNEMATATGAVANGMAKVANAGLIVGHAIIHPFQTLNRLIPMAVSGLAALVNKVIDVAKSFGKWAINNIVAGVKRLASAALNAAVSLARMAGSAVVSFLQRLGNAAKNAALNLARVAGSAVVTGLKKVGSLAAKAGKAILGLGKNTRRSNSSIKDAVRLIIRYGFGVRSLYFLFRRLRSAVVAAFQVMAQKVPEVNKVLSKLVSSFGMLKNSLATAFQPILTAVAPMLTTLMDLLSEALTRVGMFFAALTGQDYVYKATKANVDYAKSLDKTKKSAKDAENQLASFDKLDILKDNKSGDTDTEDTSGDFEKTPVLNSIKNFAGQLKDLFEKGDFATVGKTLADKINGFFGSVDWDGYAAKISNLANSAIELYNAFMDRMDWPSIGEGIATFFNGLISRVNWTKLGEAFAQKVNAVFGVLSGLVEKFDWAGAGVALSNAVAGYFNKIDWVKIGETVGGAITGVATAIKNFAENLPWSEIASEIAKGANTLFDEIDPEEVDDALTGIINGAFDALKTFISEFEWTEHGEQLAKGIKKFIKDIDAANIGDTLHDLIIDVIDFILPAISDPETWAEAGRKFAEMLNNLFMGGEGEEDIWSKLETLVVNGAISVITALKSFIGKFQWGENGKKFHDAVFKLVDEFPLNDLGEALSSLLAGAIEFMNQTLQDEGLFRRLGVQIGLFFNKITGNTELWSGIGNAINYAFADVLSLGQGLVDAFKPDQAANAINVALSQIEWDSIASQTWELAKSEFKKAGSFLNMLFADESNSHYDPWTKMYVPAPDSSFGKRLGQKLREAFGDIPWDNIATTLWNTAKDAFKQAGDFLLTLFGIDEKVIEKYGKTKYEAIGTKLGTMLTDAVKNIKWGDFASALSTAIKNFLEVINSFFQAIGKNVVTVGGKKTTQLQMAIEEFFGNVDWEGVAKSIVGAAWSAFKNIGKVLFGAIVGEEPSEETKNAIQEHYMRTFKKIIESTGVVKINSIRVALEENPSLENLSNEELNKYFQVNFNTIEWDTIFNADEIEAGIEATWDHLEKAVKSESSDVANSGADGFIDATNERKPNIEEATENAYVVDVTDTLSENANNSVDAYYKAFDIALKEGGASQEESFFTVMTAICSAADTNAEGATNAEKFYNGFRNTVLNEQGTVQEEFKGALLNVFSPAQLEALEKGKLSIEDFYSAMATAATAGEPSAGQQLKTQMDAVFKIIDAQVYGGATVEDYFTRFKHDIMENGHVKEQYKTAVNEIFGATGTKALEEGKMDAQDFYKGWNSAMTEGEEPAKTKITGVFDRILNKLKGDTLEENSPSKRASGYGENFMKGFTEGTQKEEQDTTTKTAGVFTNVFTAIVASAALLAGLNVAVTLAMGTLASTISTTLENVKNGFSGTLTDIKDMDWSGAGSTIANDIKSGIDNNSSDLKTNFKDLIDGLKDSVSDVDWAGASNNIIGGIDNGLDYYGYNLTSSMSDLGNDMYDAISYVSFEGVGQNIIYGISDGLNDEWDWLERQVRNLANSMLNEAKNELGIHSPSRVFRDEVGKMLGLGLAEGLEDTEPTVMGAVSDIAESVTDKMAATQIQLDVGVGNAMDSFGDRFVDRFATLIDRLQAITDSVTFRTPAVAMGTVVPYNVTPQQTTAPEALTDALVASNDDIANVIIQATNNAALAIVQAIQKYSGQGSGGTDVNKMIDEINRRARAQGTSPIIV